MDSDRHQPDNNIGGQQNIETNRLFQGQNQAETNSSGTDMVFKTTINNSWTPLLDALALVWFALISLRAHCLFLAPRAWMFSGFGLRALEYDNRLSVWIWTSSGFRFQSPDGNQASKGHSQPDQAERSSSLMGCAHHRGTVAPLARFARARYIVGFRALLNKRRHHRFQMVVFIWFRTQTTLFSDILFLGYLFSLVLIIFFFFRVLR